MKMDLAVGDGHAHGGRPRGLFDPVHKVVMAWICTSSFVSAEFLRSSLDGILPVQAITVVCLRGGDSRTSMAFLMP